MVAPPMIFSAKSVKLDQLYLNPANPRLISLEDEELPQYDDCYVLQPATQQAAVDALRAGAGFEDLTAKIRRLGFLPIDRIVAHPLSCEDKSLVPEGGGYVILEGNRRTAALKQITSGAAVNALDLTIRATLEPIEILVYEGDDANAAWTLQGLRHIAQSIREWGSYQQARYLYDLLEAQGMSVADLTEATGFKAAEVNLQVNSYKGFLQARGDVAYGSDIKEGDFSIFSEAIFRKPALRTWLGWDNASGEFTNAERLGTLLELIKDKSSGAARIPRVNPDLRDNFSRLVREGYGAILDGFLDGEYPLEEALSRAREQDATEKVHHGQVDLVARRKALEDADTQVQTLPLVSIRKKTEVLTDFSELLEQLATSCEGQLQILKELESPATESAETGH